MTEDNAESFVRPCNEVNVTFDRILGLSEHRPSKLVDPLSTLNVDTELVTVETGTYAVRPYLRAIVRTTRAVATDRPDVILTDHFGVLTLLGCVLGLLFRVPVVVRSGGDPFFMKRRKIEESLSNRRPVFALLHLLHLGNICAVTLLATGYFVVSENLRRDWVKRVDSAPDRVWVTPPHVRVDEVTDGSADAAREEHDINEPTVLLTVTNLGFKQKATALAEMAPGILQTMDAREDVAWVIAGDGAFASDLFQQLNAAAPSENVANRIYTTGYVNNVDDLYSVADLFIYFSGIDGYPNVVIEAQANHLPVVANPDHGIVEQVEDATSGLLVELGDVDGVTASVGRLLSHTNLRQDLGEAGHNRVMAENTPRVVGSKMATGLSNLLEEIQ